jgi:hypothetical protein
VQPVFEFSIVKANLTNIVVSTNVATVTAAAHGLAIGQRVYVSGATVDTDLNSATTGYIITGSAGANTFTFTTAGVSDATYTDATLSITTRAPRTNASCWAIQQMTYVGGYQTQAKWAEGSASENRAWDSRATYSYL